MAVTDQTLTNKGRINASLPGQLANHLVELGFGDILRSMRVALRSKALDGAAGTNKYVTLTNQQSYTLPDDAKAGSIVRAWARAGTGTKGPLVIDTTEANAAPAASHISISPSGDLVFASADAWTSVDVDYSPEIGATIELTLAPSAADTFTIPTQYLATRLIEAESMAGTLTGKMIIDIPLDAKPATGHAALKLAKSIVQFAVADAVTSARLKFIASPTVDVHAKLEAAATIL